MPNLTLTDAAAVVAEVMC